MSEVKRYEWTRTGMRVYESPRGLYVQSSDYNEAQSQLAALREELAAGKDRYSRDIDEADEETSALREAIRDLKNWREVSQSLAVFAKIIADAEAIVPRPGPLRIELTETQQRLADAERRNSECMALLAETSKAILRHQAEQPMSNRLAGLLTKARAKVDRHLKAALNPNQEAASHE